MTGEWLETQHPDLPDDFDFNYWNCAPDDQRIPFPLPGLGFVLTGFRPEGDIRFTLPAHEGRLLLRAMSGHRMPLPMLLDTVEINTDTLTVALTGAFCCPTAHHRCGYWKPATEQGAPKDGRQLYSP